MSSIFTQIIRGDIPCHFIAEDDHFFSFLDISPIAPGHTLIIPKVETDRFFDLDPTILAHYLPFAQPIAKALESTFDCNRVGMIVAGLDVPHAHLHLIPMRSIDDLNMKNAQPETNDILCNTAATIRNTLDSITPQKK
jgi:histidine triad (HIT) family protein